MGGEGGGGGEGGRSGGITRGPQSVQSVPRWQDEYSDPRPPSSHLPSEAKKGHASRHWLPPGSVGGEGGGGGEGGVGGKDGEGGGGGGESGGVGDGITRGPQSVQSVPRGQSEYSDPGPPSSQSPFEA